MKITALINLKTGPHTFTHIGILTEKGDLSWVLVADTNGRLQEAEYDNREQMIDAIKLLRPIENEDNIRIQELP